MKKHLMFLSIMASLYSAAVFAQTDNSSAPQEHIGTFTIHGDYRVRYDDYNGTDYTTGVTQEPDHLSVTYLRVRPEIDWTLNPEFKLVLQPQFAKAFGEPVTSQTTGKTQETSGSTNGDTEMTFHQAYGQWKAMDWLDFSAGREVMSYGDEVVIGPSNWSNVARSFDVAKFHATYGLGWTDVFASKITDVLTTTGAAGDKDLYGIYNGWSFGEFAKNLDVYVLDMRDNSVTTPATQVIAYGARVKSKIGPLDYRVEYTLENNKNVDSGSQRTAEVGYTLDNSWSPRFAVEYYYASAEYNTLFTSAHSWMGHADVLGRRNVNGFAGHFDSKLPWYNSNLSVAYFTFARADTAEAAFNTSGKTKIGSAAGSSSSDIGSELDVEGKLKANKELDLLAGYCMFMPGSYIKDQFTNNKNTTQYYYVGMQATF